MQKRMRINNQTDITAEIKLLITTNQIKLSQAKTKKEILNTDNFCKSIPSQPIIFDSKLTNKSVLD